jgi:hypothetical protein
MLSNLFYFGSEYIRMQTYTNRLERKKKKPVFSIDKYKAEKKRRRIDYNTDSSADSEVIGS